MEYARCAYASLAALVACTGAARAQGIDEPFDDITSLAADGWVQINRSEPIGVFGYLQGDPGRFAPQASAGFLAANYNSGGGLATISNWMVTPVLRLTNGETLTFWTRTVDAPEFADRLQVRMSTGGGLDVGATANDVGGFTTLLLDINPNLTLLDYPNSWTQFTATVSGVTGTVDGRLAFRYFVENAGPNGTNSDYIGIDQAVYSGPVSVAGACCFADGTCLQTTTGACTSAGGTYRGDATACATIACPQPPGLYNFAAGPVLIPDGTGTSGCGTVVAAEIVVPESYTITSAEVGVLVATGWQGDLRLRLVHDGVSSTLADRPGVAAPEEYGFSSANFGASPTNLMVFRDSGPAAYDLPDVAAPGINSVAGEWKPESGPLAAFVGQNAQGVWRLEAEDCAARIVGSINNFRLLLGGAPAGGGCYANCDQSTINPVLNVADFSCFLQEFGQGSSYANCDGSTTQPVLNVADFSCFLQEFAGGCD